MSFFAVLDRVLEKIRDISDLVFDAADPGSTSLLTDQLLNVAILDRCFLALSSALVRDLVNDAQSDVIQKTHSCISPLNVASKVPSSRRW